ncbi:hypothetical protein GR304_23705 [Microvirga sp. SYSU G3D207]|uniref:Uncharacterized protein n=3 Tax=Microvirga TaxID=186650 RepID=A0ABW9Z9K0_9HYPH|nr:hypothetical protein [Microvirga arsenatis]NBJ13864.1 hypothetical protein [Microvirga arsenatis]NBJ27319.1 hypothetical protein [Microvirga arsenatis]
MHRTALMRRAGETAPRATAAPWSTYFHDEILRALRREVSGMDDIARDAKSVQRLALDSRRAQINIRSSLDQIGLPDNLIKLDETPAVSSSVAVKS